MTKYSALYIALKNRIQAGELSPGEKLPSKRIMADRFGCSLITVEKAYGMLEDEGYLYAQERKGYFVADIEPIFREEKTGTVKVEYIPEDAAQPEQDFEYSVWFKTVRKVIAENGDRLFTKSPNKGCAVLRNAIADYLRKCRGMNVQPQQIIVGSGAEQLYAAVAKVLGRDKVIGIEDPSYIQIAQAYLSTGVRICPLRMGDDGIETDALYQNYFDVLHVTPFHSYPSGVTTSLNKRYEYLKWAESTGNFIVEDDYDSEFYLPGHPIESLYALDRSKKVIYINTFSKSLSPAMRMGYMILPESLNEDYDAVLGNSSCTVPVMDQYILARFLSDGHFERHLNRIRRKISQK